VVNLVHKMFPNKKALKLLVIPVFVAACSTTPRHVGEAKKTQDGDEYSIKDSRNGFVVAGHYSEHQFIRNSRQGFTGCMRVINDAARSHADAKGKQVLFPKWNEIEIIDHGRDIITAIMNVNCQYEYKYISGEQDFIGELERLQLLLSSGAITKAEFDVTKAKVLSNVVPPKSTQESSIKPTGRMAYEAEATAIKFGCIGSSGGRPVSNLIGKTQDMERYQITCTQGISYVQCKIGQCFRE